MVLYGPWMDRVLSKRITMPYIVHFKSPVSWTVFVVQRGHIKIRGGGGGGGGERERENRNCLTKSREKMTRLRVSLLEWSINSHSPTFADIRRQGQSDRIELSFQLYLSSYHSFHNNLRYFYLRTSFEMILFIYSPHSFIRLRWLILNWGESLTPVFSLGYNHYHWKTTCRIPNTVTIRT